MQEKNNKTTYKYNVNPEDISSFANFQEFQQTHIHINNTINFEKNM
jgi:hypothetical protein